MFRFIKRSEWKTVHTSPLVAEWACGEQTRASVIFQKDQFGNRRLKTEGNLFPADFDDFKLWHTKAIPWREGLIDDFWNAPTNKDNVVNLRVVK